jgi:hypothetical protein
MKVIVKLSLKSVMECAQDTEASKEENTYPDGTVDAQYDIVTSLIYEAEEDDISLCDNCGKRLGV